ncbi:zeta toxin family protein [Burkholderia glumae]|uniref:zeta toxin family protein n=1 Tax=Burkholderia glumae TaxID=337 RepID=UPI00215076C2|nr:zeta toxin family protein [Burkholderia glumae]
MDHFSDMALERAYTRAEREALDATRAQSSPRAILIGGQPGTGKTVLARLATEELRDHGGAVLIDADRLREHHPDYARLLRTEPARAADLTHPDAARMAVRLTQSAMDHQRNVVVDGTMRNPENLLLLAERLRARGYQLEVRGIAMSADASYARAQLRTEREIAATGVGRVVNRAQHEQAYTGMLETISRLEQAKAVDVVRIYDGQRREIYANDLVRGDRPSLSQWAQEPNVGTAIARERERPRSPEEAAQYTTVIEAIAALRAQRELGQTPQTPREPMDQALMKAPEAPDRDLRDTLRSMTRDVPNLGGRYPDPVAQQIAESPNLPALEARLRDHGISRLTPIDAGASSVVLAADDRHVVRLGKGDLAPRPAVPEMLQPLASGTEGNLRYEILPRADTRSVTHRDLEQIEARLRNHGYQWGDKGLDNIGIVDGRAYVLDPGGVERISSDRPSPLAGQNQALLEKMRLSEADRTVSAPINHEVPAALGASASRDAAWHVDTAHAPRPRVIDPSRDAERARAFDSLPRDAALALFPELDAAYHHLDERTRLSGVPQSEIERADLSARLHRGDLPRAESVPDSLSRHAIGLVGERHGLILREADQLEKTYRGEVLGTASHHALIRLGNVVGVVYPRERLSRDLEVGERVAIQYSRDSALHQVREHDAAHEAERSPAPERGIDRAIER